jgi:hypothetical protein
MADTQVGALQSAFRHVADARFLLTEGRFHQAYHLAGFGPECARKAVPGLLKFAKAIGHDVAPDDLLRTLFAALENDGHRYDWDQLIDWRSSYPTLAEWTPIVRYTGNKEAPAGEPATATQLVDEAEEVTFKVLASLYADGAFPEGVFQ